MLRSKNQKYTKSSRQKYRPTSKTRPYDLASVIVPTFDNIPGQLFLGPAPGKKDTKWNRDLNVDLETLHDLDVDIILCMLEWSEMLYLRIPNYSVLVQHDDFLFHHVPTVDHTAPALDDIVVIVPLMAQYLLEGYNVLVHCRGGMGRAATICACILVYLHRHFGIIDYYSKNAINDIRIVRPKAMKNESQMLMVDKYAKFLDKY